jgi:uncharacterized membrane protein
MAISTEVSIITTFTALVAVSTMMFSVYVPATKGYFNLGEVMVYISAILFGARVGGIAGGLGSMIADILLGYPIFAPATLIIKGLEGTVVGFLSKKIIAMPNKKYYGSISVVGSILFASFLGILGALYYGDFLDVSFNLFNFESIHSNLYVSPITWIFISIVWLVLILLFIFRFDYKLALLILSVIAGGLVMITGYFIYEWFLFGSAAIIEIPINIGQMVIGGTVALPITGAILKRRQIKTN